MFDMPLILNGVGEPRLNLVIDRYRLAFIESSYIEFVCDVIDSMLKVNSKTITKDK